MATETVKLTKYFVQYYAEITKNDETSVKTLETEDTDYSPFVEYSEDTWQDAAELPSSSILIKTVVDTETDDSDNEIDVTTVYYYTLYSKEVEIEKQVKSVCAWCIYHEDGVGFRRHLCKHEDHLVKDYIAGIDLPGNCRDYNESGQCGYYQEDFIKVEESENADEETSEETENDSEDTSDDAEESNDTEETVENAAE